MFQVSIAPSPRLGERALKSVSLGVPGASTARAGQGGPQAEQGEPGQPP